MKTWKAYSGEKVFLGKGEAKNIKDLRAQILKSTALPDIAYIFCGRYGYTISDIYAGRPASVKGQGVIFK